MSSALWSQLSETLLAGVQWVDGIERRFGKGLIGPRAIFEILLCRTWVLAYFLRMKCGVQWKVSSWSATGSVVFQVSACI